MSLIISRTRGLVSILAAAVLIILPIQVSAASASTGTDTSLSVFTVNGNAVVDDQSVSLPVGTTSVTVVAETTDPEATRVVTGATSLLPGDNPLVVEVTAADGVTTESHSVNLSVQTLSDDTSLSHFLVNGVETVDGEVISLPAFTGSVIASAQTTDVNATFVITGDSDLVVGENVLTVTVTAQDGTVSSYQVTLAVAFNSDASLATFQVNGTDVVDGSVIYLDPQTLEVDVLVETTDLDASYELSGDTDLVAGENTLSLIVTAADGESTEEFYVTLNVAFNTDASAQAIYIDGNDVVDGEVIDLQPGAETVDVSVETTDPEATFEIVGDNDLVIGENTLTITVTAADSETTQDYVFTLNVPDDTDTTLSAFQINGEDVEDGASVEVEPLSTSVDVFIETTDLNATYEITGDSDLVAGDNDLIVTVTAADGMTVQEYIVTVNVLFNTDTSADVTIDGTTVLEGDSVTYIWGTEDVVVDVLTVDQDATFEVVGDSSLVTGENTLVVIVTAADGQTIQEYSFTINILQNTDTSLATFQVDGSDVSDGESLDLSPGTTSVEVTVETTDPDAAFEVVGDTQLVAGENDLIVTVTAANGQDTQDHLVVLVVPASDDTSLSTFTINDSDVEDGDVLELDNGTTDVDVNVETNDADATFTVTGDVGLQTGDNTLVVSVTAADGETNQDYTITLVVLVSADTSLATFQVNGLDVVDGDIFVLEAGTDAIDLAIETTDPDATYEVVGDEGLVTGENDLVVSVTAADGVTTQDHLVTLVVLASDDASLSTFTVNDSDVVDGDVVELENGTTDVDVSVETTDADATFTITGDSGLLTGDNSLVVNVVAADGETTVDYTVTLVVLPSTDTSLATFQVNGEDVEDGATVELAPGSTAVDVVVEATDPDATVEIAGDQDLNVGSNELVVSVTAADGVTTADYVVTLEVAASDDASVSSITVNDEEVSDGDVVELDNGTTDVDVNVETTDADATFTVSGDVGLVTGENTLLITVTAADGETTSEYTITLVVAPSSDTSLVTFQVNGEDVEDGSSVELVAGTTAIDLSIETTDPDATYEVVGDEGLVTGENDLVVSVTAADGVTTQDYLVTLVVLASDDTSLASFTVNDTEVEDGDVIEFEAGTTDVEVSVETNDPEATFEINGGSGLVTGENFLVVTVTAADTQTSIDYTVTIVILPSTDTSLATFQVNGEDVEDGATVELAPGVTAVDVVVEATDPDATVKIAGDQDLTVGSNELVVTVTAADGVTSADYVVTLEVAASDDASVSSITVNGDEVSDGDVVELDNGTTDVDVNVETTDAAATVVVSGDVGLVTGENTLLITVTAADGETTSEYTITLVVAPSSDTSLVTFQVNGEDVEDDGSIELEAGTTEVGVTIETTDPDATYEISGENELVVGENTLNVTVTAADGVTTQEYFVTMIVLSGASTDLSVFTVNGSDVVDGDVVDIEPGVTDVEVVVETEDPDATVTYEGDSGLQPGENILVVTVTSADGENTSEYLVTLNVLLGIDTSLAVFQVDGNDVADGDVLDLEPGTTDVEVTVETTDLDATVEISGDSDLSTGENVLSVRVTAADGETTQDYFVTLNVAASNNANISAFTINGSDVVDGDTFEVDAGVTSVEVSVETEDPDATYEVTGATGLVIGENELVVTVTAADGETTAEYKVTLYVPSNDTAVTSIQVDGLETLEGDIVSVPSDATSADVSVTTRDENAKVVVTGADELQIGDNTITVTVTAQDGTTRDYVFTIRVGGASADTTLTSLTFNGVEVTPGATVNLPPRSTSVAVVAVTRDPAATVKVVGRTGLVVGNNDVTVTVTAPDLVNVRTFTIRVVVAPLSSNTNLSTFTVNGTTVQDQGVLELVPLTRNVDVVAQTEDVESVAVVTGKSGLIDGNNTLTVTVTAANGSKRVYTVTLNVRPLSTDTSLRTFTVNGLSAVSGVVTVEPVATSAVVVAEATDTRSSVVISGGTGLRVGDNFVTVLVTAESGATKTYKATIKVPASNNTSLKSIEVNGVTVEPSSKVTLPLGTTGALVKALAQDPQAKVVIVGGSALVTGDNNVVVTVTAADGTTFKSYSVNLFVTPPSSDTTLKIFKINGVTVTDGGTIVVPALTTSVSVDAAANSAEAKVVVSGKSGLVDGPNKVDVTVTAGNGSSTTYSVTVTVIKLSNDTSLKTFTVNGADYNSQVIEVAYGTRSVDVVAIPTDAGARASVIGNGGLRTGQNQISVKVTAANGVTAEYVISVTVKKASNTDLTILSVNNQSALNGETITLPAKTGQALVKVVTSDPEATFQVTGTTLQSGNNTVNVSVNAADGTNRQILISVYVTPLSSNTALSSFKVNGEAVVDAGSVNVANRTVTVPVVAVASDAEALVAVSGNTGLKTGSNTVSVTVTAANGTKKVYTVTVVVAKSANTDLSVLSVNGVNAVSGSVTLPARTSSAVVKAVTVDTDASVAVTGTTLSSGANTVTVTVTAADGTNRQTLISVYVTPLSTDTSLKTFTVNGISSPTSLDLPVGSKSVVVVAVPNDAGAKAEITGTSVSAGSNTVRVRVTAPSGDFLDYNVAVNVAARSTNANLSSVSGSWTINGVDVSDSEIIVEVPAGTTAVAANAKTADAKATLVISGASGLTAGLRTVTFTVTAEDGTTISIYERSVRVKELSSNTNLTSLTVADQLVENGGTVNLPAGTSRVSVVPVLESDESKFTLSGNTDLVTGTQNVVVIVTAPSGASATYTIAVVVARAASNTNLSTFTINGTTVANGGSISVAAGTTRLHVSAIAEDAKASVAVTGKSDLKAGANTLTVTVTALSGDSTTYTVTVNVGN